MTRLLRLAETLYRGVNRVRRDLYRRGVLEQRFLPRPVVSVGNLTIGGSGKTPTVIALSTALRLRGLRVAILTRGYGRSDDRILLVRGDDVARYGDEPVLIARRLPEVDVVVGPNRLAAGLEYLRSHDCDVFILDDGFQHLQLHRDVDVVIQDQAGSWFREGPSALEDADFILVRDAEPPSVDRRAYRLSVRPSVVVSRTARLPAESLRGKKVLAFSGLARNDQFFNTLSGLGAELVGTLAFPDHHRYSPADIEKIRSMSVSRSAESVVTTEKDSVKVTEPWIETLVADAVIDGGEELLSRILEALARA